MAITGVNTYQDFEYTGGVQSFTAPISGTYLLFVWGAQGGMADAAPWDTSSQWKRDGGWGGYATGYVKLTKGTTVYIVVGESPTTRIGGYNGGGNGGGGDSGGGGGATHIAINKNRTVLSNYSIARSEVLIVAGGGGGGGIKYGGIGGKGGSGGGIKGEKGTTTDEFHFPGGLGGTQTEGGKNGFIPNYEFIGSDFGRGTSIIDTDYHGSAWTSHSGGGGGGYYGGGGGCYYSGGGGGSGYIGGVTGGSMGNSVRLGHGRARITLSKIASQLYYNGILVEKLNYNNQNVEKVIYNGITVMG